MALPLPISNMGDQVKQIGSAAPSAVVSIAAPYRMAPHPLGPLPRSPPIDNLGNFVHDERKLELRDMVLSDVRN